MSRNFSFLYTKYCEYNGMIQEMFLIINDVFTKHHL